MAGYNLCAFILFHGRDPIGTALINLPWQKPRFVGSGRL